MAFEVDNGTLARVRGKIRHLDADAPQFTNVKGDYWELVRTFGSRSDGIAELLETRQYCIGYRSALLARGANPGRDTATEFRRVSSYGANVERALQIIQGINPELITAGIESLQEKNKPLFVPLRFLPEVYASGLSSL